MAARPFREYAYATDGRQQGLAGDGSFLVAVGGNNGIVVGVCSLYQPCAETVRVGHEHNVPHDVITFHSTHLIMQHKLDNLC